MASILKSPLASTTPAGVSIARARLSRTLCATRIGCTRNGPISTGWPGSEGAQVGVDAALLQPLAREAESEAAAVDGRRRGLQRVGERADVVLVAVREEDPAELLRALGQVLEVGDDRVDAGHLGRREEDPGVEQQEMLLPLEHERVEAELTEPAERHEAHRRRVVGTRSSQDLAPGGSDLTASQIAANSTTDSVSALLDPSTLRNLKYSLRLG